MKSVISIKKAAKTWEEGLPIGNGKIGASVLGKISEEMITINEESIWYGPLRNRKNPDCIKTVQEIRELLLKGEVAKAQFLAKMAMTSTPKYMNPYQPAGDLKIQFLNHLAKRTSERKCYLDLDEAIAWVKYDMYGVHYEREHFVSQKYNVVVIRLTADKPGMLTISANMNRKPFEENSKKIDDKTVCNYGQCGADGINYFTAVRMVAKGADVHTLGDFVYTQDADEVILYVSGSTDFSVDSNGIFYRNEYFREQCVKSLDEAENAGYDKIKKEHMFWYKPLYNRVNFEINGVAEDERIIEEQLDELKSGNVQHNDYLTVLLFNFAKYLMISSSYDCKLPANLQGIWNGEYVPPWQSEFTININTEMNYWMVEKCNLPECHMPLFDLIDRLVINGRETAKQLYGCRGFCAHHNTNLWANSDPEGIMDASPFWVMGGAWLSLHMYEHFLYTGDMEFLQERALPVMREALLFFEDYLYKMEDGTLVTGPTVSPENTYLSSIGQKGALCMGPAMDIQILRQLCKSYLMGAALLDIDNRNIADEKEISEMLSKLPDTKISSDGRVMEWNEEYEETEKGHRHISHMYGLHPGNEITEETPELFAAAEKTIDARLSSGGGHTGWSRAWIACFFARLKKGDKVMENIDGLLQKSIKNNMYDTHPPFQIDGNFGIAEAMAEAIVQSHCSYIEVLPALPPNWKNGKLEGVRLRAIPHYTDDGEEYGVRKAVAGSPLTSDIYWQDGNLKSFYVTADEDCIVDFKYADKKISQELKAGQRQEIMF